MRPGMRIMDTFILKPYYFPPANPHFRAEVSPGWMLWKYQYEGHGEFWTGQMRSFPTVIDVPDVLKQQPT